MECRFCYSPLSGEDEEYCNHRCRRMHGPMWVVGWIDSNQHIEARVEYGASTHTEAERMAGRPWRWNIQGQDWMHTRQDWRNTGSNQLNAEERMLVADWLERHGWKDVEE